MIHPPNPRKGKVAGPDQIAATFLETPEASGAEHPHHIGNTGPDATVEAAMLRLLRARLDKLGLAHSAQDESILIAGQAYDLRSATAMARQLGRPAT